MLGWARRGDRSREFEEVALVHLDVLYRTALRLTHHRAEAEDLVQDTCLRAYRSFDRFNPGTNCRAWLLAILRNAFLNRARQAAREVLEAEVTSWETEASAFTDAGPEKSPEEEFLQTVLHGDLDRALGALPLPFQEAVMLVDLEGLSYKEAASPGAARSSENRCGASRVSTATYGSRNDLRRVRGLGRALRGR
jgi:RNA polymerase sigma-70 factor, ECF subfamily